MTEHCQKCRYWVRVEKTRLGGVVGECRFNPPMVYPGPEFQADRTSLWPRTKNVDWCGKFTVRQTAQD